MLQPSNLISDRVVRLTDDFCQKKLEYFWWKCSKKTSILGFILVERKASAWKCWKWSKPGTSLHMVCWGLHTLRIYSRAECKVGLVLLRWQKYIDRHRRIIDGFLWWNAFIPLVISFVYQNRDCVRASLFTRIRPTLCICEKYRWNFLVFCSFPNFFLFFFPKLNVILYYLSFVKEKNSKKY